MNLSQSARDTINSLFRDRGYPLKWLPPPILAKPDQLIEVTFPLLAAHLMLTVKQPYFIGIGANDGVTHDPLFPFIRDFGWCGVMVEPLPQAFLALERNYAQYRDVKLIQAAISRVDGSAVIHTVTVAEENSTMMSLHSSFDRDILLRGRLWHPDLEKHIVAQDVPVMSFKTLLSETNNRSVDVLKIDTEGHDLEILRTVDLSQISPRLILAEHANIPRADKIEMANILLTHGYKVAMTSLDMLGYRMA